MSTHNICLYKEVKKTYTDCSLKTTEFLDCALIGVCAVIRSNTVTFLMNGFGQGALIQLGIQMRCLFLLVF